MKKIGVKFCGGCNPRYDRGEALEAVPVDIDPMEYFENLYTRYLIAGEDCQIKDERNLLDSGLLLTTEEAYANPSAVAYQSQEAIKNGGSGSSRSRTYFVLMEHEVLKLEKDGNDFILYGRETYDISKYNTYARLDDVEKQAVRSEFGNSVADDREFRIHESRDNYEKLRIVKDSDGRWKIYTREYVKPDGSSGIQTNEVYEVE